MSKTIEELDAIWCKEAWSKPHRAVHHARQDAIRAVVRALREDARSVIDVEAMLEKILGEKNDAG